MSLPTSSEPLSDLKPDAALYDALIGLISEGVIVLDSAGKISQLNPATPRILGLSPEQIIGRQATDPLWRTIHEDGSEFLPEEYPGMIALKTGKPVRDVTMGVRSPSGKLTWILLNAQPIGGAAGQPEGSITILTDITEKVETRRVLAETQRIAQLGTWEWDLETNAVWWSDQVYRLLGYEPRSVPATFERFMEAMHPEDREPALDRVRKAVKTEEILPSNLRMLRTDGAWRIFHFEMSLQKNAKGRVTRSIGVVQDVTESETAAEKIRQSEQTLKRSQQRLQDAQRVAGVGDFELDLATRQVSWSEETYRIYELDPSQPPDMNAVLARMPRKQAESVMKMITQPELLGDHQELLDEYHAPSGQMKYIQTSFNVLKDSEGQPIRFFGTIQDVTERKRLLDSERRAREQAVAASRAKDIFLATLSHELRTPLTTILAWAQMLREGRLDPEQAQTAAENIESAALSQKALINDLLDVSRIVTGRLSLDLRKIEPGAIISRSVDSLRPLAQDKQLTLELKDSSGGLTSLADPIRLRQIFENLLANALKFTPAGGNIRVTVESIPESGHGGEGHIEISVTDTGRGIAPGNKQRIFDLFAQGDDATTRAHGGLGLGLAIVRNLTEMMGGTVEVESPGTGRGSTFRVRLPIHEAGQSRDAALALQAEAAKPQRPTALLRGLQVLIVEDDPATRESLRHALESHGARPRTAASAAEAIRRLGEALPDVILSDIAMPEEDGLSLIRRIRSRNPDSSGARISTIPAIAVTAFADHDMYGKILAAGYDRCLMKPIDLCDLVEEILEVASLGRPRGRQPSPPLNL